MKRLLSWVRHYFGFTRTETNGFLILLPLLAVIIFSEPFFEWWTFRFSPPPKDDSRQLDSIKAKWTWARKTEIRNDSTQSQPFRFDPNKASAHDLTALGVPKHLVDRIQRYRVKGGKFRIRSEFKKIYGMDSATTHRLENYIDLPDKLPSRIKGTKKRDTLLLLKRSPKPAFDLNLADSMQLIELYGIGPKLSKRIISYRSRLGGFVSFAQLKEVYGLDTLVIDEITKKSFIAIDFEPRRININKVDKKELTALPYIRYALANAIVTWRFQHGDFKSLDELRQIVLLDPGTFEKIKPYLTVKD